MGKGKGLMTVIFVKVLSQQNKCGFLAELPLMQ